MALREFDADGVRLERTGWRDQAISARHRLWGFNCPAVDLDFLMVEYNLGKPVGLIEYKHYLASDPNLMHPTYRALRELADLAGLPFAIARYWPSAWSFQVSPINDAALEHFNADELLTEREFVSRLYAIRSLAVGKHVLDRLSDALADELVRDWWEAQ